MGRVITRDKRVNEREREREGGNIKNDRKNFIHIKGVTRRIVKTNNNQESRNGPGVSRGVDDGLGCTQDGE